MKVKRICLRIWILAAVLGAGFLWGCQKKTTSDQPRHLRLSLDAEISTLDAQAAMDSASLEVVGCIMEGLYTIDGQGNAVNAMAEKTERSEDGKTFIFTIRDSKWSDGSPVTADDFVYGWQRAADPALGNSNAYLLEAAGISGSKMAISGETSTENIGVRALDKKTLEVTLDHYVPYFESMLAFPTFFPVKRQFAEQQGERYGLTPDSLLYNGPFVMKDYSPSATSFTLVKNRNYWDKENVETEMITYQVIKAPQQGLLAYQNGDLDVAALTGEQADQLKYDPEYTVNLISSLWYISPNQKREGLDNLNLRLALALAFDQEKAAEKVMKDGSKAAFGPVPFGLAKWKDGTDFAEGKVYLKTNKEKAAMYWEKAKKELGQEITLSLLAEDTEVSSLMAQYLQAEIEKTLPGLHIKIETVPKKVRLSRMASGDYDLGLVRWGADFSDPEAFLDMWTSQSPYNYGSWSNKEYDEWIAKAGEAFGPEETEERLKLLKKAEEKVMEEAVIFPVCQKAYAYLVSSKISGAEFHPVGINRIFKNLSWNQVDK